MFNNIGLTLERWARDRPIRSRDRHSNLIVSCKVTEKKFYIIVTGSAVFSAIVAFGRFDKSTFCDKI